MVTLNHNEQIKNLLQLYSADIDKKRYSKRIPYTTWKQYKNAKELHIHYCENEQQIFVYTPNETGGTYYNCDDDGFGEFLTELYFTQEKGKADMTNATLSNVIREYVSTNEYDSWLGWDHSYGVATPTIKESGVEFTNSKGDKCEVFDMNERISKLENLVALKADKTQDTTKENKKMKGFNFDFGPCNSNTIKMSIYGLAVKNANGTYVSYDATNDNIMDVDIVNFDGAKYLFKMPVAIKDVKIGDIVIHAGKPMFVTNIGANAKSLYVVDPISGEKKEIMLTRSPFGFDFATKIVNFLGDFMAPPASADNPFGNMWMLMLANNDKSTNSDNRSALSDILPFMFMNQNNATMNPMMLYFLSGNGNTDLLPFLFMMNNNPAPHTCTCNCGKTES